MVFYKREVDLIIQIYQIFVKNRIFLRNSDISGNEISFVSNKSDEFATNGVIVRISDKLNGTLLNRTRRRCFPLNIISEF